LELIPGIPAVESMYLSTVKKFNRLVFWPALLVLGVAVLLYLASFLPVITGYSAKTMCSGIFLCGRKEADLRKEELGHFPFSLASVSINWKGRSVSSRIWGLAEKKAVYRPGFGATLLNGIRELELRPAELALPDSGPEEKDSFLWKDEDTLAEAGTITINEDLVNRVINSVFAPHNNKPSGTRAILVVYRDLIIAERYAEGFSVQTKQIGWSMTKGILNALIGQLVYQGRLQVRDPAPVEDWRQDERKNITTEELMQMTSGLRWQEFGLSSSSAATMLFKEKNMAEFAARSGLAHVPGEVFNYSDGSANILSGIIRQVTGDSDYYRFPYKALLHPIGMDNTILETDAAGNFVGSSYCYATARDWAKLGLLYLHDGISKKKRILPEGWVKFSTTSTFASHGHYGALFWVNDQDRLIPGSGRAYPHVPPDCYSCQGYQGQYIWIIPSRKLVIVRLALEPDDPLDPDHFLAELLKAFPPNQDP
jgi:CubicO group peptidase (beta-lactamase class C family)